MWDRETLRDYILWFIDQKKEVRIRRVIDRKPLRFYKKAGEKATTDEIINFINESFKGQSQPSERTIYRALEDLREAKMVKYAGPIKRRTRFFRKERGKDVREGTTGTYAIDEGGKKKLSVMKVLMDIQSIFLLNPDIPAVFVRTSSPRGKLVFLDSAIRISDPKEIEIIEKAFNSKYFRSHKNEFRDAAAVAQKLGLLLYCKSVTDSRLGALVRERGGKDFVVELFSLLPRGLQKELMS